MSRSRSEAALAREAELEVRAVSLAERDGRTAAHVHVAVGPTLR